MNITGRQIQTLISQGLHSIQVDRKLSKILTRMVNHVTWKRCRNVVKYSMAYKPVYMVKEDLWKEVRFKLKPEDNTISNGRYEGLYVTSDRIDQVQELKESHYG